MVLPSAKNPLDEHCVVRDAEWRIIAALLGRQRLGAPLALTVPKPMTRTNVKLSLAVAIPTAVSECRKVARVCWDILGSDNGNDAAMTCRAERKERGEKRRLQNKRREIAGTLREDAGKDTNERAVSWRRFVLVSVMGIRKTFGCWYLDDISDTRSFTRR